MRHRSFIRVAVAAALVAVSVIGLAGCKPDTERAAEAVAVLLDSYVVPVADEEGKMPEDPAWPASDYGDAATMEQLEKYGVSAEEWRENCFRYFGYQVGETTVDGSTAKVSVSVTNASLAAAVQAAGADFTSFTQTAECEELYAQGGKAALFGQLVSYVYAHLGAGESQQVTTVTVTCTKADDGSWVPQTAGDAAFFSALYGGSNVTGGLMTSLDGDGAEAAAE